MRLYPAPEPFKLPTFAKVIIGMIIMVIAAWLCAFALITFIVISDPQGVGETFGEVGASIINGFNNVIEE